jgi:hypothetical protein
VLKTKDEKLASFLIIRACKYLNFGKLHRRHLSLMKLSKLNMSLENKSAEKGKRKKYPAAMFAPFATLLFLLRLCREFFPLTLLFRVTNVIQKIQGLSLPVFYIGTIWLHELFQLRRKKGRDGYRKKRGEVT